MRLAILKKQKFLLCLFTPILMCAAAPEPAPRIGAGGGQAGCFNVEQYINNIRSLSPAPRIRHITTQVKVTSNSHPSHKFLLRLAYGNFAFKDTDLAHIPELTGIHQADCKTVKMSSPGEPDEEFHVRNTRGNFLSFENNVGQAYSYEWISPQHLRTTVWYLTGDYLCDANSKFFVRVDNDYSWNNDPAENQFLDKDAISPDFLGLVAEAADTSFDDLYTDPSDGKSKQLSVEALKSLASSKIRSGLGECD